MRKLASIQKIEEINPIEGYDRVELATVLGWSVIVSKSDNFKVGDLVVYFEPDSQLYPHKIWDDFLSKRKYRIKTLKMCKTISQGLVLPLSIVKELAPKVKIEEEQGFDLTDILKVTHYQKESDPVVSKRKRGWLMTRLMRIPVFRWFFLKFVEKKKSGNFPSHIMKKTDETNIQAIPFVIKNNVGRPFYISEKLEGQCGNYFLTPKKGFLNVIRNEKDFWVCSHNVWLPEKTENNWWKIAEKYDIRNKLFEMWKTTGIHFGIQGEIIGPAIQENIYKLDELQFYIFNVKNLDDDYYLTLEEKREFCEEIGIPLVPILEENVWFETDVKPSDLLEKSNGKSVLNKKTDREGFVIRRMDDDRVSFKVRSPKYLLKQK